MGATQSGSRFWKEGFGDCPRRFAQGAWGLDVGVSLLGWVESSSSVASPFPQQGARVFGALGPIGPSSPGLALGGLAVSEHRLSNKLLAWSGVLEWQEVSARGRRPGRLRGGG